MNKKHPNPNYQHITTTQPRNHTNNKSTGNQGDDKANDDGFKTVGKASKSTNKTPAKSIN